MEDETSLRLLRIEVTVHYKYLHSIMVRVITDHKHYARVKDCSGKPAGVLLSASRTCSEKPDRSAAKGTPKTKIRHTLLYDVFLNLKSKIANN
jgi:hypothetical protein